MATARKLVHSPFTENGLQSDWTKVNCPIFQSVTTQIGYNTSPPYLTQTVIQNGFCRGYVAMDTAKNRRVSRHFTFLESK